MVLGMKDGAKADVEAAKPIKWADASMSREPTEAMLIAARDWSQKKYGKPIGDDAAIGCWQAMFDAATIG